MHYFYENELCIKGYNLFYLGIIFIKTLSFINLHPRSPPALLSHMLTVNDLNLSYKSKNYNLKQYLTLNYSHMFIPEIVEI